MLLDDVMSELDRERRGTLIDVLRATGGQSVITTTELEHVPGGSDASVTRVAVHDGTITVEAPAPASPSGGRA
jgi:DNA replication and repair protein RecF